MIAAIILVVVALTLPNVIAEVRASDKLRASVNLVLIVHQLASVYQAFLGGLPTMRMDPMTFHRFAALGEGRLEDNAYAQFLQLMYSTFGPSHFLGCQVSAVFFSIALLIEVKILYRLDCELIAPRLVLVFGLPLSCVFNTSVTLREAAQMAFFLGLVYLLLQLYQDGPTLSTMLVLPLFLGLHKLHHGLTAAVALVLPLGLAWSLKSRPIVLIALLATAFSGSFFFLRTVVNSLSQESRAFSQVASGNLDYVQNYAQGVEDGRTDFGIDLDLSSVGGLVRTGPPLFFYYLYSPLPWQVRGATDVYGLIESFLRLGLTYFAISGVRKGRGRDRDQLVLVLIVFMGLEAAWAAGTANWGTAFRHRLVAWGLLVAAGGRGWMLNNGAEAPTARRTRLSGSIRERRRALRNRVGRGRRRATRET